MTTLYSPNCKCKDVSKEILCCDIILRAMESVPFLHLTVIITALTRSTRGVRVVFSVTRMRSSNNARMNKFDFTTEEIGSVLMTVFKIVAPRNVDNWIQIIDMTYQSKQCTQIYLQKNCMLSKFCNYQ